MKLNSENFFFSCAQYCGLSLHFKFQFQFFIVELFCGLSTLSPCALSKNLIAITTMMLEKAQNKNLRKKTLQLLNCELFAFSSFSPFSPSFGCDCDGNCGEREISEKLCRLCEISLLLLFCFISRNGKRETNFQIFFKNFQVHFFLACK